MDDAALVGVLLTVLGVLVAGVGGTAGYLYATDYGLQADVEQTQCHLDPTIVRVKTTAFGIDHDVTDVPPQQCVYLQQGDHVIYHVRTKHTILYRGGQECYDSEKGVLQACYPETGPAGGSLL